MKTYSLDKIGSRDLAVDLLGALLPGQESPWLLADDEGDVIAYVNLIDSPDNVGLFSIQADLSGRHYHRGSEVVAMLKTLQEQIGGSLGGDD